MDFRATLNKLDRLTEGQKWDDLDAIVTKYAKPGMTLTDLAAMEKEAAAAEPADAKDDDNVFSKGFSFLKQAASTEDFRKKYVLAHAAEKLNLPGLYDSAGKSLHYLNDDGESTSVGGANKTEAQKINDAGLLPKNIQEKFGFAKREVPVDDETSLSAGNPRNKEDGASTQAAPDNKNKNEFKPLDSSDADEIVLSDGTRYSKRNSEDVRQAYLKAKELMDKADALAKKAGMEESLYRNAAKLLGEKALKIVEEVSTADTITLKQYIDDLKKIASASFVVQSMKDTIRDRIKKYEAALGSEENMDNAANTGIKPEKAEEPDFGSEENMDNAANTGLDKGSEENMDDEKNTGIPATQSEKFKSGPATDLADFAKSGRKGLANEKGENRVVKELQSLLGTLGFDAGKADGIYGRKTKNAVEDIQDLLGITVDGDAGPATIEKLLKLKDFKYNGKGFAALRKDLERAETLIKKGGAKVDEANDFRKLLNILEGRLFESLTDAEADELAALLKGFESVKDDAALPAKTAERISTVSADSTNILKGHVSELELDQESDIQDLETMPEKETEKDTDVAKDAETDKGDAATDSDEKTIDIDSLTKDFPELPPSSSKADLDTKDDTQKWDDAESIVDQIKNAILGPGTDEESVYDAIGKITDKEQWDTIKAVYPNVEKDLLQDLQGGEEAKIRKMLKDKGVRLASFSQILTGRDEKSSVEVPTARKLARDLESAMKGFGTDEDAVYAAIDQIDSLDTWEEIRKIYPDVDKDLDREFGMFEKAELLKKLREKGITLDPSKKSSSASTGNEWQDFEQGLKDLDAMLNVNENKSLSHLSESERMRYYSNIINEKGEWFKKIFGKGDDTAIKTQKPLPLSGGKFGLGEIGKFVEKNMPWLAKTSKGIYNSTKVRLTLLAISLYTAARFPAAITFVERARKEEEEFQRLIDLARAAENSPEAKADPKAWQEKIRKLEAAVKERQEYQKNNLVKIYGSLAAEDSATVAKFLLNLSKDTLSAVSDFPAGVLQYIGQDNVDDVKGELEKAIGSAPKSTTDKTTVDSNVMKYGEDPEIYNALSDEEKALYDRLKGKK